MIIRNIYQRIQDALLDNSKNRAIIIYGARQVGKTTLAKYCMKNFQGQKEYFNCDFPDVIELFSYNNIAQIERLVSDYDLIVLDEVQRIKNIGIIIKIIVDNYPNLKIIATGSSNFDLSNELKEPLTARKYEFNPYPF
jgi:uncharacterized protein